jgi:PPM family protein phosphatase
LLRDQGLVRLTTDHTWVQTLVDEGHLAPEDVFTHPYRSAVLKSVDAETDPAPDVFALDLARGDRLMICSDGLSDMVDDHEIARLLGISDPEAASSALIEAALEAGGRDNVTCLVADVEDGPVLAHHGATVGAACNPYLVVDPAAVRLAKPA